MGRASEAAATVTRRTVCVGRRLLGGHLVPPYFKPCSRSIVSRPDSRGICMSSKKQVDFLPADDTECLFAVSRLQSLEAPIG